jgi:hypothetical protein
MRLPAASVLRVLGLALLPVCLRAADAAADSGEKLRNLGLADSGVSGPPLLRVLLTFLLVVGLAWTAAWLLRRHGFRLPGKAGVAASPAAAPIRMLARSVLPGGITCQVVAAQGRTVLITVTRSGVTSLVLGDLVQEEKPAP